MSKKNKPISAKKGKPSKQGTDKGQSISKRDILRIARLVFEQNDGRVLTYKQVCHAFGKTNMGQKRAIYQTLVSMAEGGEIQELEPGRFVRGGLSKERLEGRFDYRAGRASFIPDDPDTDTLRGEFIGLNSGADFYAKDVDTLRKEGETSLRVYLDMCKERGITPCRQYSGRFNVRISPQLHAAAVADNSVDQLNAFPDLRRFCCRRPDG